jgi:hypothetical protein
MGRFEVVDVLEHEFGNGDVGKLIESDAPDTSRRPGASMAATHLVCTKLVPVEET